MKQVIFFDPYAFEFSARIVELLYQKLWPRQQLQVHSSFQGLNIDLKLIEELEFLALKHLSSKLLQPWPKPSLKFDLFLQISWEVITEFVLISVFGTG